MIIHQSMCCVSETQLNFKISSSVLIELCIKRMPLQANPTSKLRETEIHNS